MIEIAVIDDCDCDCDCDYCLAFEITDIVFASYYIHRRFIYNIQLRYNHIDHNNCIQYFA